MGLRHIEIYTVSGLVTLMWHGKAESDRVVLCAGGAMGGLLGPGDSFFHELGLRCHANTTSRPFVSDIGGRTICRHASMTSLLPPSSPRTMGRSPS